MNTKERNVNQQNVDTHKEIKHNLYTIMSTNSKLSYPISFFGSKGKNPPVEITEGRVLRSQMKK
jgi:hypothetical protein